MASPSPSTRACPPLPLSLGSQSSPFAALRALLGAASPLRTGRLVRSHASSWTSAAPRSVDVWVRCGSGRPRVLVRLQPSRRPARGWVRLRLTTPLCWGPPSLRSGGIVGFCGPRTPSLAHRASVYRAGLEGPSSCSVARLLRVGSDSAAARWAALVNELRPGGLRSDSATRLVGLLATRLAVARVGRRVRIRCGPRAAQTVPAGPATSLALAALRADLRLLWSSLSRASVVASGLRPVCA